MVGDEEDDEDEEEEEEEDWSRVSDGKGFITSHLNRPSVTWESPVNTRHCRGLSLLWPRQKKQHFEMPFVAISKMIDLMNSLLVLTPRLQDLPRPRPSTPPKFILTK